jgi:hypothetical protein
MVYRTRINYSAKQKMEILDRWQPSKSQTSIGKAFDRNSSSVFGIQKQHIRYAMYRNREPAGVRCYTPAVMRPFIHLLRKRVAY